MGGIPKFSKSNDGLFRANLNLTFRLTAEQWTNALANHVLNLGVDLSTGQWVCSVTTNTPDMKRDEIMAAIRWRLQLDGETAARYYDGPQPTWEWARRQVALVEKKRGHSNGYES